MGFFRKHREKKEAKLLEEKNKILTEVEEYNSKQEWKPCRDAARLFKVWRYKKMVWYYTTDREKFFPKVSNEDEHKCTILQRPCETERCLTCAVAMRELGLKIIIKDE